VKALSLENSAIIMAISLMVYASPLVVLQAVMAGEILLPAQGVKFIVAIIFLVASLANILIHKPNLQRLAMMQLPIVYFVYGFFTIVVFSSGAVGSSNAIMAFFYNYGLLLFVLPYYWIAYLKPSNTPLMSIRWLLILVAFIMFADLYGMAEFFQNNYFMPSMAQDILRDGDYIKFDHIDGLIRVSSLFKSPLEFGIINVFISGFLIAWFWSTQKKLFYGLLFLLSSGAVFSTVSRTAILMYACNILLLTCFYVLGRQKKFAISKRSFFFWLILLCIVALGMLLVDVEKIFSVSTNPTNLQIRLNNWMDLISGIGANPAALLFGLGVVQNGAYGEYHNVVIDNLYIGAVMTGGILGLIMFLALYGFAFLDAWKRVNTMGEGSKVAGFSFLSFYVVFLIGGLTENLMHLMFYPFSILLLLRLVPQKRSDGGLSLGLGCEYEPDVSGSMRQLSARTPGFERKVF